jgi:hypothetical protein
MAPLTILTWHVHGSYLEALGRTGHDIVVPVLPGRPPRYGGRPPEVDWPPSIREVTAEDVRRLNVDLVLYQHVENWRTDQHVHLSQEQRRGPRIFLEHDPPAGHPTDTRHPVDDPDVLLVHVTPYNALMWDAGRTPTRVIDHGVEVPDGLEATLERPRGIVVINDLLRRGRRLGADLVMAARESVSLDLYGMGNEAAGGVGSLPRRELMAKETSYRFFFHPARHTSLGLGVIEAMLLGLPVVGLATTELPTVIDDGVSGIIDTRPERLYEAMTELVAERGHARRIGLAGREAARARFGMERFVRDWDRAFRDATGIPARQVTRSTAGWSASAPAPASAPAAVIASIAPEQRVAEGRAVD